MAEPSNATGEKVLERPQTTIGAQDLLAVCRPSKQGFLRKQGQLERTFKFLKWRQRFVVLSRGCVYIFNDEYSNSPLKSTSMKVFKKCQRWSESSPRWAFSLVPENSTTDKTLFFTCSDDSSRRDWMKYFRDEMVKAKNLSDKESKRMLQPGERDEYVFLEKEVRTPPPPVPGKSDTPSTAQEQNSDNEEDYTTIDETKIGNDAGFKGRPAIPAPEPVKEIKKSAPTRKQKMGKWKPVTPPESPIVKRSDFARDSFQFDGNDREEIKDILTARPEGTYLVRKSRNDNREVLSVNVDGDLKEFKIYERDPGVTINNSDHFEDVETLLNHYTSNTLPNKKAKLYRAYSQTDPGYMN